MFKLHVNKYPDSRNYEIFLCGGSFKTYLFPPVDNSKNESLHPYEILSDILYYGKKSKYKIKNKIDFNNTPYIDLADKDGNTLDIIYLTIKNDKDIETWKEVEKWCMENQCA